LAAVYLFWAFHRTTGAVLIADGNLWPRPLPYPDQWLGWWEQKLDAAHPAPPGFMKLDGEWERLQMYLVCMTAIAVLLSLFGFIWLLMLKRVHPTPEPLPVPPRDMYER